MRPIDSVVIGSRPEGQRAIAAAKLDHRVAVVDGKEWVGVFCLHTGTIPLKSMREATKVAGLDGVGRV